MVIDYRTQDFAKILSGYDVVLNSLDGDTLERSLDVLKPGGKLIAAIMPLRATFGFSTSLRSASQGRAGMTMQFREFDLAD